MMQWPEKQRGLPMNLLPSHSEAKMVCNAEDWTSKVESARGRGIRTRTWGDEIDLRPVVLRGTR